MTKVQFRQEVKRETNALRKVAVELVLLFTIERSAQHQDGSSTHVDVDATTAA